MLKKQNTLASEHTMKIDSKEAVPYCSRGSSQEKNSNKIESEANHHASQMDDYIELSDAGGSHRSRSSRKINIKRAS